VPHLHILSGAGASHRRLVSAELERLASLGYEDVRRQEGGDWVAILSENRGRGLWGDRSVVVVEDADRMGPMPGRLSPLLEGERANTHILLVCKSGGPALVPKEFAGLCAFAASAEPSPWSGARDGIIAAAAKRHGVSASRDAISLLKEMFDDTGELASEAEKASAVCALAGRGEISALDVREFCMSDGSRNLLKLLDGICEGRVSEAVSALGDASLHSELAPLLSALHNRFRLAMYFALFPKEKSEFASALGAKNYASKQAETAARRYGGEKLRSFVTGLMRAVSDDRSGGGASWRDLSVLVIDLLSGLKS
jgi:DNA polymerase-3 subunit delta